jgi:hypothetical protein
MVSPGYQGYRCRYTTAQRQGRVRGMCPSPQTVAARIAAEQLRGLFGLNIGRAAALIVAEHERQRAAAQADPIAEELAVLDSQEATLLDLAIGGSMSEQLKKRYDWVRERRALLLDRQARQQTVVRLSDDQVAFITALGSDPLEVYDELGPNGQAEIWRLLKVRVRVTHAGGRGASARYRSAITSGSKLDNEGSIWLIQSYLTQTREIA